MVLPLLNAHCRLLRAELRAGRWNDERLRDAPNDEGKGKRRTEPESTYDDLQSEVAQDAWSDDCLASATLGRSRKGDQDDGTAFARSYLTVTTSTHHLEPMPIDRSWQTCERIDRSEPGPSVPRPARAFAWLGTVGFLGLMGAAGCASSPPPQPSASLGSGSGERASGRELDGGIRRFRLVSPRGRNIWVYLPRSERPGAAHPVVLVPAVGDSPLWGASLAERPLHIMLARAGLGVVAFEVSGDPGPQPSDAQRAAAVHRFRDARAGVADGLAALATALAEFSELSPDRVVAAGEGTGASSALLLSSAEPRIMAVLAISPVPQIQRGLAGVDLHALRVEVPQLDELMTSASPHTHAETLRVPTLLWTHGFDGAVFDYALVLSIANDRVWYARTEPTTTGDGAPLAALSGWLRTAATEQARSPCTRTAGLVCDPDPPQACGGDASCIASLQACLSGAASACQAAAGLEPLARATSLLSFRVHRAACLSGHAPSCHAAATPIEPAIWWSVYGARERDRLAGLGCEAGDPGSCHALGLGIALRHAHDGLRHQALPAFRRACELGSDSACETLASEGELEPALAVLRDRCPTVPTACYWMGNALANADRHEEAVRVYRLACDGLIPGACHALAEAYRYGRGVRASPEISRELYEKACADGVGCRALAGLLANDASGLTPDPVRARAILEAACRPSDARYSDRDVAHACRDLAYLLHEQGKEEIAREAYRRACELGDELSCASAR